MPRASGCGCMRVCRISCLWTNDTLCRWLDQACTNVVIVAHQGGQQEKVACSEPEMGLTSLLPGSSAMTANHNSNTLPTESKTNLVPQATVCSLTESSEMFCYSPPRLMVPKLDVSHNILCQYTVDSAIQAKFHIASWSFPLLHMGRTPKYFTLDERQAAVCKQKALYASTK